MLPWAGEDPKSFFCYRDELVSKVITEVKQYFTEDDPDYVQGIWLLTEYELHNYTNLLLYTFL